MLNSTARKWLVAAGAIVTAAAFIPQGSWAASDPPVTDPPKKEKKAKAKDDKKDEKKGAEKNSALDQEQTYGLAYWQAKNGHYEAALATLRSAQKQDDPRIQTMLGFTLRKLGRVDEAFSYYHAAIATRPEATTTRQYLGEAYLQIGDVARAKEQLAAINQRCGTTCEDYTSLAAEIAKYEAKRS